MWKNACHNLPSCSIFLGPKLERGCTVYTMIKEKANPLLYQARTSKCFSLSWGRWVYAGANPSYPGQVTSSLQGPHWWQRPPCKVPMRSNLGFSILLKDTSTCSSGIWTSDLPITCRPALPAEPQLPQFRMFSHEIINWSSKSQIVGCGSLADRERYWMRATRSNLQWIQ